MLAVKHASASNAEAAAFAARHRAQRAAVAHASDLLVAVGRGCGRVSRSRANCAPGFPAGRTVIWEDAGGRRGGAGSDDERSGRGDDRDAAGFFVRRRRCEARAAAVAPAPSPTPPATTSPTARGVCRGPRVSSGRRSRTRFSSTNFLSRDALQARRQLAEQLRSLLDGVVRRREAPSAEAFHIILLDVDLEAFRTWRSIGLFRKKVGEKGAPRPLLGDGAHGVPRRCRRNARAARRVVPLPLGRLRREGQDRRGVPAARACPRVRRAAARRRAGGGAARAGRRTRKRKRATNAYAPTIGREIKPSIAFAF